MSRYEMCRWFQPGQKRVSLIHFNLSQAGGARSESGLGSASDEGIVEAVVDRRLRIFQ